MENLIFKLDLIDFNRLFKISGLTGNSLSTFKYDINILYETEVSDAFEELIKSKIINEFSEIILEPDLIINFKSGGSISQQDFYQVFFSKKHKKVIAQFKNSKEQFINIVFKDLENFIIWWSDLYCSIGQTDYKNIFTTKVDLETIICFFAGIDFYKKVSMESMLEYKKEVENSIYINNFLNLIKSSLASSDTRWLLPTLFELNSKLKNHKISLQPNHLENLKRLNFFDDVKDNIITISGVAQAIGVEFLTNWLGAVGIEIIGLLNNQPKTLFQAFLTSTAFTNHLILFNENNGKLELEYQNKTKDEIVFTMKNFIGEFISIIEEKIDNKVAFCGECGQKIIDAKNFCPNCGASI